MLWLQSRPLFTTSCCVRERDCQSSDDERWKDTLTDGQERMLNVQRKIRGDVITSDWCGCSWTCHIRRSCDLTKSRMNMNLSPNPLTWLIRQHQIKKQLVHPQMMLEWEWEAQFLLTCRTLFVLFSWFSNVTFQELLWWRVLSAPCLILLMLRLLLRNRQVLQTYVRIFSTSRHALNPACASRQWRNPWRAVITVHVIRVWPLHVLRLCFVHSALFPWSHLVPYSVQDKCLPEGSDISWRDGLLTLYLSAAKSTRPCLQNLVLLSDWWTDWALWLLLLSTFRSLSLSAKPCDFRKLEGPRICHPTQRAVLVHWRLLFQCCAGLLTIVCQDLILLMCSSVGVVAILQPWSACGCSPNNCLTQFAVPASDRSFRRIFFTLPNWKMR